MKKILLTLSSLVFGSTVSVPLISCKTKNVIQQELLDKEKNIGTAADLEIINEMAKQAVQALQKEANTHSILDTNQYQNKFHNMFIAVNSKTLTKEINRKDGDYSDAIGILQNSIQRVFNQLNLNLIADYSNYYQNKNKPVEYNLNDAKYILNYIDVNKLKQLSSAYIKNDLKAVRLDLKFKFDIKFKKFSRTLSYNIQYVLTNDAELMKMATKNIVEKFSKVISTFFTNYGKISINLHSKFRSLYNNFNINFSTNHIAVENIIFGELRNIMNTDPTLSNFTNFITYQDDLPLLNLISNAINNKTNNFDVVNENTASYNWTGKVYLPEQITTENFVNFYRSLLDIFKKGTEVQIADFTVSLLKISIAGLPLSGIVMNNDKPLMIKLFITEEGITNKLHEFANLVVAFYKHFKIESNNSDATFHVPEKAFNEILQLSPYDYRKVLKILINDFKKTMDAKALPGIDIFTTGNWTKNEYNLSLNSAKNIFTLRGRRDWNFDLIFGKDNAIYYTGWTSTLFDLKFVKKF